MRGSDSQAVGESAFDLNDAEQHADVVTSENARWDDDVGVDPKADALVPAILRELVSAATRPVTDRELVLQASTLLDRAWASVPARKLRQAVADVDSDGDGLRRDAIGRLYSDESSASLEATAAHLDAAARLADQLHEVLEETTPPRGRQTVWDNGSLFAHRLLTPLEEQLLGRRVFAGDRSAINELVEANTRLAADIASRVRLTGAFDVEDGFQEGCLGLIRAAEKFDYRKGYRFSTYATWWIRQAIHRGIADKARTIRLPVHVVERLNKIRTAERRLVSQLGREPTVDEIADATDLDEEDVVATREAARTPQSLDEPLLTDGSKTLADTLIDESCESPYDEALKSIRREALSGILEQLSHRERRVLQLRNGLAGEQPHTLDEVGRAFNVTRERIRQIENQAIEKLVELAGSWVEADEESENDKLTDNTAEDDIAKERDLPWSKKLGVRSDGDAPKFAVSGDMEDEGLAD